MSAKVTVYAILRNAASDIGMDPFNAALAAHGVMERIASAGIEFREAESQDSGPVTSETPFEEGDIVIARHPMGKVKQGTQGEVTAPFPIADDWITVNFGGERGAVPKASLYHLAKAPKFKIGDTVRLNFERAGCGHGTAVGVIKDQDRVRGFYRVRFENGGKPYMMYCDEHMLVRCDKPANHWVPKVGDLVSTRGKRIAFIGPEVVGRVVEHVSDDLYGVLFLREDLKAADPLYPHMRADGELHYLKAENLVFVMEANQ